MHIGNKIKELTKKKEISAIDFAAKMDLTKQNVYNIYERPHINTELLLKISEVLEVPLTYFFTDLSEEDAEKDLIARNYRKLWDEVSRENETLKQSNTFLKEKLHLVEGIVKNNEERINELKNLLLVYEKLSTLLKER